MDSVVVVLVVEDEALIHDVLEGALEDGGYAVKKAYAAAEAMQMLDARGEEKFSALITDINLGSKTATGWEVARHARELFPLIPVVYTTTASADEWTAKGVPKSILITKPFATSQVVSAVAQLINEAISVSASNTDDKS